MNIFERVSHYYIKYVPYGGVLMKQVKIIKTAAAVIAISFFAMIPSGRAEAGIPVVRSFDGWKESMILSSSTELQNYIKDVLTNLDGIKSIMELSDLTKDFEDITKAFDFGGFDLEGMFKGMLGDFGGSMKSMNAGDAMRTGKLGGETISNTEDDVISVLQGGAGSTAAALTTERSKRIVEEALDLPATSGPKKGEETIKGSGKEKEKMAQSAMIVAKETVPMSFAGLQESSALLAAASDVKGPEQQLYALNVGDNSRMGAIQEIVKVLAPYTADEGTEGSYMYGMKKIREQSEKALEKAAEHSKGGPSEALKTIAGLSAVLVEQQGLQNQVLMTLADSIAADVKMSGINALLEIESYSSGVQENIGRYIDIYNRVGK